MGQNLGDLNIFQSRPLSDELVSQAGGRQIRQKSRQKWLVPSGRGRVLSGWSYSQIPTEETTHITKNKKRVNIYVE